MQPSKKFKGMNPRFWAYVKLIGQLVGYARGAKVIAPTLEEISNAFASINFRTEEIIKKGAITDFGKLLLSYFSYRADVLNNYVANVLMGVDEAHQMYHRLSQNIRIAGKMPPLPMNKQKGDKKNLAFFTCIINMLIARSIASNSCDYDPRELTIFSQNDFPLRTLSRRVDGAYPSVLNPKAIWEIKEYYYTTTFGSRVADGVYETLLDGHEIEELNRNENVHCYHYLFVDGKFTWWNCGKSYLCRLIDMMHTGDVDEVIFGKEVEERIPEIVKLWI